jgi:hypothetical protein
LPEISEKLEEFGRYFKMLAQPLNFTPKPEELQQFKGSSENAINSSK